MDLSGIAAISFDGDGTLWDFQAAMHGALAATLAELHHLMPGAQGTGLNRTGASNVTGITPDIEIATLTELVSLLIE